jgi:hypothetical protein
MQSVLVLLIIQTLLLVFSAIATLLSLIFMLFPDFFAKIEEFLGFEFGGSGSFATLLEGKINFVNDWVFNHRSLCGPLLCVLAAVNTKNAFLLFK